MAQPYFFHLLSRAARCVVPSLSGPAATQCASAPCASSAALATRMLSDAATLGPGSISDHSMSALRRRLTAVCGNHQHLLSRVGSGMTTSMHRQGLPTPMSAQLRRSIVTSREPDKRASAAELALYWGAASIGMVGVSFASVPLYKIFCAATGYGGAVGGLETVEEKLARRRTKPDAKVEAAAADREVTVWFNADVAQDMPWEFTPTQEYVRVKPGQSTLVFFTARNKTDQPVTGYSVFNVTPDKSAQYFNKIQCFCFEMQRLRAHEEIDMPVFFYVDPEFATDWNCRNVDHLTLSYMFHRVDDEDLDDEDLDPDAPTVLRLHGEAPAGSLLPSAAAAGGSTN